MQGKAVFRAGTACFIGTAALRIARFETARQALASNRTTNDRLDTARTNAVMTIVLMWFG